MHILKMLLGFLVALGERGTASAKSSTFYTNYDVNKYPADARDRFGRLVPICVKHTVVSGETVSGTVNLAVHPANWRFVGWSQIGTDGLSASAGVGQTPKIGNADDDDVYLAASDFDVAPGVPVNNIAGNQYTPTADKIVKLTYGATGTPVVGQSVKGTMLFIPPS